MQVDLLDSVLREIEGHREGQSYLVRVLVGQRDRVLCDFEPALVVTKGGKMASTTVARWPSLHIAIFQQAEKRLEGTVKFLESELQDFRIDLLVARELLLE